MIQSAINYYGSKRRLLSQILPLFPSSINTFYDLFAGSGVVSLNVHANRYVWNDFNTKLVNMFSYLYSISDEDIERLNGYASKVAHDKSLFYKLRDKYNDNNDPALLYALITCSFNTSPRFNRMGQYNMPYASPSRLTDKFLLTHERRLLDVIKRLRYMNIEFSSYDYRNAINFESICDNDFIYVDPPYFGTDATYNRSSGWTDIADEYFYRWLGKVVESDTNFALSNVLSYKGNLNQRLSDFIKKYSDCLNVHHLDIRYTANRANNTQSDEVLVTNYN